MRKFLVINCFLLLCLSVAEAKLYKWKDDNGNLHVTTQKHKVPLQYRAQIEAEEKKQKSNSRSRSLQSLKDDSTVIQFQPGRHVVVNVLFNDKVTAPMIVDTGANVTTITEQLALKLGIDPKDPKHPIAEFKTAGGVVKNPIVTINQVELKGRKVQKIRASISNVIKSPEYQGLLGLDFFRNFIYTMDVEAGTLTIKSRK